MEESRFLQELRKYLLEHWGDLHLSGSSSGIAYRIRHPREGRAVDRNRVVALWFNENPEEAQVATKWVSNNDFSPLILKEHQHVKWLYETQKHRFVPRPLGCPEISGVPVLIEAAVPGRSFAHQIIGVQFEGEEEREKALKVLKEVFPKAAEILRKIRNPLSPATKESILEELEPDLCQTEKILNWSPEQSEEIRKSLRRYPLDPVPGSGETFLIGDFVPQNILSGPGGTFVIDFEFSRKSRMAFLDPLSFVSALLRLVERVEPEKTAEEEALTFRKIIEGKSFLSEIVLDFLVSCGLSPDHLDWYWLLFFVHETAFQHFLCGGVPSDSPSSLQALSGCLVRTLLEPVKKRN